MGIARLTLVTGKGGTGKSAVAAAMALRLSAEFPTTLVDLDQRLSAAGMLGIAGANVAGEGTLGRTESTSIAQLETVSLSPRSELEAFIGRIVPIRSVARRMLKSRTFGYVSAALPGLEAFLMLERLRIISARAAEIGGYAVADAPATGSALELLAVPGALKKLAPFGTLNRLAIQVENFVKDAAMFSVVLTMTPHQLALREALEASDMMRGVLGVKVTAMALNRAAHPLFVGDEIHGLRENPELERLARWRAGMAGIGARARREAMRAGMTVVELPMLFSAGIGREEIEELGRAMDAHLLPDPSSATAAAHAKRSSAANHRNSPKSRRTAGPSHPSRPR
jgi:Anion-transporting ATPase